MALASILETGCYGDGAFGHQHTRERCADAIRYVLIRQHTAGIDLEVPRDLMLAIESGDMSDDASEEDDACAWLEEHAPLDGHWWGWRDGDFGLWPEDDRETLT